MADDGIGKAGLRQRRDTEAAGLILQEVLAALRRHEARN
jgi:hypothetical protein